MSLLMAMAIIALVAIAVLPTVVDPEERQAWRERFVAFVTCHYWWQHGDAAWRRHGRG